MVVLTLTTGALNAATCLRLGRARPGLVPAAVSVPLTVVVVSALRRGAAR